MACGQLAVRKKTAAIREFQGHLVRIVFCNCWKYLSRLVFEQFHLSRTPVEVDTHGIPSFPQTTQLQFIIPRRQTFRLEARPVSWLSANDIPPNLRFKFACGL
ncbi:hypothetical protein DTO021C3_7775 [Paecilomyces variotii]|nr:hypothetical protein DTO021C3_7775 [Paecilomyces variotii]